MRFRVESVHYMPKELQEGVLYVSEEFGTAAHLCACGCGEKIRTPLGPTEWSVEITGAGPSLAPSVGNWQKGCKSHYWITDGQVFWSSEWSEEEILAGRTAENAKRQSYYGAKHHTKPGFFKWIWLRILRLFGR